MATHYHKLHDNVVMPMNEYLDEHKRLIHALESKDPQLLMNELKEQTQEMKKLQGGRAGVTKASGFIMRMMAENKLKHSGQYKKPTKPAHKDSTMNKWIPFDYAKLANKSQGGEKTSKYGASPFIQRYFKDKTVKFQPGKNPNLPSETPEQQEARIKATENLMAKRGIKKVRPELHTGETKNVIEHFGNVGEKKTNAPTLEIKEIEPPKETKPKSSEDIKEIRDYVSGLRQEWYKTEEDIREYLYKTSQPNKFLDTFKDWILRKIREKYPDFTDKINYYPNPKESNHFSRPKSLEDVTKVFEKVVGKSEPESESDEDTGKKIQIEDEESLAKANKFVKALKGKWDKHRKDVEKYLLLKGKISDLIPTYRAWVVEKMKPKFELGYAFKGSDEYDEMLTYPYEIPNSSEKVEKDKEDTFKDGYEKVINEIRDRPLGYDYTQKTKDRMGKNDARLVEYFNTIYGFKSKHKDKLTPEEYEKLIKRETPFTEERDEASQHKHRIQQQANILSIRKTKEEDRKARQKYEESRTVKYKGGRKHPHTSPIEHAPQSIEHILSELFYISVGESTMNKLQQQHFCNDVFADNEDIMRKFLSEHPVEGESLEKAIEDYKYGPLAEYATMLMEAIIDDQPHLQYVIDDIADEANEDVDMEGAGKLRGGMFGETATPTPIEPRFNDSTDGIFAAVGLPIGMALAGIVGWCLFMYFNRDATEEDHAVIVQNPNRVLQTVATIDIPEESEDSIALEPIAEGDEIILASNKSSLADITLQERKNYVYLRSTFFNEDGTPVTPNITPQNTRHSGQILQHFWIGKAHIVRPRRDVEMGMEMVTNPLRRVAESKAEGRGRRRIKLRGI